MTVGERIRKRRKELGISADMLAEHLNVSRSTVFRYENGYIEKMPLNYLKPIAEFLHTSVDHLMGWDEETEGLGDALLHHEMLKPIPRIEDGLSERDLKLLMWFRSLPEEKQKAILISQDAPEDLL